MKTTVYGVKDLGFYVKTFISSNDSTCLKKISMVNAFFLLLQGATFVQVDLKTDSAEIFQ